MFDLTVAYLPIGRKTFDLEAGEKQRSESKALLTKNINNVFSPDEILTSVEDLEEFLSSLPKNEIDLIVYQSITFADSEFITKAISIINKPVIVWSVREPSVGGRLRLNSLTGGNTTCHTLKVNRHQYEFVFGDASEKSLQQKLHKHLKSEEVVKKLRQLTIGVVGEHPPGFDFSGTDEDELRQAIGVNIHEIDLYKAFEKCVEIPEESWLPEVELAQEKVFGLSKNDETVEKFAQFTTYIRSYINEHGISALAVRCWPDFFTELGAAACSTLSHFTDEGIVSSCESDIHGSITMYILKELAGGAPYLGDLVHVNEDNNSVTFWHCGAGAYSLANPKTGANSGLHPNRKMGFTLEFGLKAGIVTLARLSKGADGYKMFVMTGKALDTPQQFNGTSVEVELEENVTDIVYKVMDEGLEPHFVLAYGDVKEQYLDLARRLGIEVIEF